MEAFKNNSSYPIRNVSGFTKFFWWCSGANQDVLMDCPQSEHNKYVGIGATVFFTGVLATLSGGYALFSVFKSVYPAIAFGIIWGLVIFNLDRFIVSTLRKDDLFWNEFKLVLPRLILAIILAIVISKPLELKIFEKEIAQKVEAQQREFAIQTQRKTEQQFNPVMDSLRGEIDLYKNEIAKVSTARDSLYIAFIGEAEGTRGTNKLGKGPVFKEKKQQYDKIEMEMKAMTEKYQPLIDEREKQILQAKAQRDSATAKAQPTIQNYDGLMARLDGLSKLPSTPSLFIMLLFICIETAPVLSKLFSAKGPYDEKLKNIEHEIELNTIENINYRNHELNKKMTLSTNLDKAQIEQEILNNKESLKVVSDAHLELTKEMVNDWLEKEKANLKKDKV
ncbi:MAG TPA: DUF4407 domain-containing protein [Chitinophagales bacterium]|jgi:hypothetical protein|nr:DUF4407 domain-containing protein [Chitinophagales bacterium]MBP6154883.1 DUF4407 domain-containing protein [Chitinophagales bacterium]HQV78571.1 DUF4407 domain-containing protein [Chitinophagales bacterium]HQW79043.1 DUF4407 domain-containing protein [Chitinophagales bacterium]HRB67426.1 DUF4407 domain-containing protein [Chitinophagales bacterium]